MPDNRNLPPGQSVSNRLPVLHRGPIPKFHPSTWDFRIWGAVEEPVIWTWDQIQDLPRIHIRLNLHCVTGWSVFDTEWVGVSLKMLIAEGWVKLKPDAHYLMQHADFGYSTSLPLNVALQENFLLATHYAGKPLTPEHGYPLRGVIGSITNSIGLKDLYLWKGAKWLRGLEFMTNDRLGFWESNGYHNGADVWKEQRSSFSSGFDL